MGGDLYFGLHAHFYQPPRSNPATGRIEVEPDAAPYHDWNERVNADCYRPNAANGNFEHISFDVGETLLSWLAENDPETYERIIEADASHMERHAVGNALAMPYHHVILPLARQRDKRTQLIWGREAFAYRFGREPEGIWLPEMAVDIPTLQEAYALGYRYTVLSMGQVHGEPPGDAGPYWVELPDGGRMAVFLRDDSLSNDISFNLSHLGGAGHWARYVLSAHRRGAGPLTLVAVDGETFGHHYPGEDEFLRWLVTYEALAVGYRVTTLGVFFAERKPRGIIKIKEQSSWSCFHGVERWLTGCDCTPGDSSWKPALRRALDNLESELDHAYEVAMADYGVDDPWALRDGYISVILGRLTGPEFLERHGLTLTDGDSERVMMLMDAQFHAQQMFTSDALFYGDMDRAEVRRALMSAAYAIRLTREATGRDASDRFRLDLRLARCGDNGPDGAQIYDEVASKVAGA